MKFPLPLILAMALAGCSRQQPAPSANAGVFDSFKVTFAVVKAANNIAAQFGFLSHTNGCCFESADAQNKFAAWILAHPNNFSFTTTTGNFVPFVFTGHQTGIQLALDPKRELDDLDKYGLSTTMFEATIDVKSEDPQGNVFCNSFCAWNVHLKQPLGGSVDQGGSGGVITGIIPVGKPVIASLFQTKDSSLWELIQLDRVR